MRRHRTHPPRFDAEAVNGAKQNQMRLRFVVGFLLMLVGVGLPLAAMSSHGPPWGFRGHHAVVIELVGTVEGTMSEARRQREKAFDDKLLLAPNTRLDVGDELRVARLSQGRLRLENADLVIGDGARLTLAPAGIRLARGVVDIALRDGAKMATVEIETGGTIIVRGVSAKARVLVDGKGGAVAWVKDGSVEGRTARADVLADPGREVVIHGDDIAVVPRRSAPTVSAMCSGQKLTVVAPPLTQVFAAGTLAYPDVAPGAQTGSVIIDVDADTQAVPVVVRDVHGQPATTTTTCARK